MRIVNQIPQVIIDASQKVKTDKTFRQENNVEHLGTGNHSTVYRLFDKYVVKIFSRKAILNEYLDYIYLEELQGIPYIPTLYAYSERDFMITEYAKGEPLLQLYLQNKELPFNLIPLLSDAIYQIYQRNIAPVDLKVLDHIIWDEAAGSFKIIDFGVCDTLDHMPPDFIKRATQDSIDSAIETIEEYFPNVTL